MVGREAGSPAELITGHMDQVKSQWATSEVATVISFQLTAPPQQRPDLRLVSQVCVLSTLQWNKKGPSLQEPR